MSQPRTLGVVIVALLVLVRFGFASAQEVPCDNREAPSVIPTDVKGKPAMSHQIENDFAFTIDSQGIRSCLLTGEGLENHVIKYADYVTALANVRNKENPDQNSRLVIKDSVMWARSQGTEGMIDLSLLGEGRAVSHSIQWTGMVLGPRVSGRNTVFSGNLDLSGAKFHGEVNFTGAEFGTVDFEGVKFAEEAEASFAGSIFGGKAQFGGAQFHARTSFVHAQFNMEASFTNAIFNKNTFFEGVQFRQRARFNRVQFVEGARVSFAFSIFDGEAHFTQSEFTGWTRFQYAQFKGGVSFQDTKFYKRAIFDDVSFAGHTSFRNAEIKGSLQLVGTTWGGRVDFREATIAELAWDSENRPSSVRGVFDAREAVLKRMTIKDVHFADLADFSGATFGGKDQTIFADVVFEKAADFLRADFQAEAIFVRNRFRGLLDFTNATFAIDARLCLLDNRIGRLHMDREHLRRPQTWQFFRNLLVNRSVEQSRFRTANVATDSAVAVCSRAAPNESVSDHEHLPTIYRSIESSFRNANDRWGENEAWYLGTVASRMSGSGVWDAIWDYVHKFLLDIPSRYGIDYVRTLAVSASLILLFWVRYWLYFRRVFLKKCQGLGPIKLAPAPEQRRAFRFRPFERIFHASVPEDRPLRPWQDALFLSCRAFFKLGVGSSYPRVLAWLVYVQWTLGMYMLIHFLFVLKNTLPIALPFLGG